MHLHPITIIVLTLTIVGCGNQEEEVSSPVIIDNSTNTDSTSSSPTTTQTDPVTVKTSELITSTEFDLSSSIELVVNVPAAPSTSLRYFINICSAYSKKDGAVSIQYESCKLRASLTSLPQQYHLTLSSSELHLVAQIWPIESGAKPITRYFENIALANNWDITL